MVADQNQKPAAKTAETMLPHVKIIAQTCGVIFIAIAMGLTYDAMRLSGLVLMLKLKMH
jgi:hypothetical protein